MAQHVPTSHHSGERMAILGYKLYYINIIIILSKSRKPHTKDKSRAVPGKMSKKGGAALLQKDAPWRASSEKPVPRIHHSPILRLSQTPHSDYAISVMKHPNPIGSGLAEEAIVEAAGPDCIVPGQITPIKLLGVKVWPITVELKFLEPVGRELKLLGKFMDDAVNLMNKSFIDR